MLLYLRPTETNTNQQLKKIGGLSGYFSVAVGKKHVWCSQGIVKNREGREKFKQHEAFLWGRGEKGWLQSQCDGGSPAAIPARHCVEDN